MSENIYIEIENETCIICLEKINVAEDYLTTVCVKCNVMAHISCLNEWYQKKNKKMCPICLKTEKYYLQNIKKKNNIIFTNYCENKIENKKEEEIKEQIEENIEKDKEEKIINNNNDEI